MSTRRHFLKSVAAGMAWALSARASVPQGPQPGSPKEGQIKLPPGGVMPLRPLGRTGVQISLLGLGGYHLGLPKEEKEAVRIIHAALDHGINFLDNCWDYHEGLSELRMGMALGGGRRQKAFVMTKLDGRTRDAATRQLEQSLRRLGTDVIDLVQIHEVIRLEDAERVFAPGGAMEALVAARQAGKLRFIGFTGHKSPDIHLHMLEVAQRNGFRFDTVQMPLNVMDPHYASFEKKVLPVLQAEGIGVLGMKPLGSGIILKSGVVTAGECLAYAMNLPTSVVITGCETLGVLEQGLATAYALQPMKKDEMASLLRRTAGPGARGQFERFKTTTDFDGTTQHPQWLETATL